MADHFPTLDALTERSRNVFRTLVETYLETGQPVGSRTLSRQVQEGVSAATIRNVMQDLELAGLLDSPHTSAGRMPTHKGLRLFVDGLMEVRQPEANDRAQLDQMFGQIDSNESDVGATLDRIGRVLSGVTQGASLVLAPKHEAEVQHIEFVSLAPDRALVVLVFSDGHVENRVFRPPAGQTPSSLREAANFVNAFAGGQTLSHIRTTMAREVKLQRAALKKEAADLIETGIAVWADEDTSTERLIVRGRGNLLSDTAEGSDLERIRSLFDDLERKRDIADFLELAENGEGVRIFIGSENELFSLSGSSLVVSPYMNSDRKVIGAIGVIGPTRLNYGRVVPVVDYTAQLVGRLLADRS